LKHKPQTLIFGEVLFDRFPDGTEVLGGAPFNVAWNLHGLGFEPLLISAVGDDDLGRRILTAMQSWGMDRSGVQVKASHATGIVNVGLEGGEPSFDIVAERAWDEISFEDVPRLPEIALLYHGTLALRQKASAAALGELTRHVRAPVLVDVNLRKPWWNRGQVLSLLSTAELVKMNEAELLALVPGKESLSSRARELVESYQPELLCVTRGAAGAVAFAGESTLRVAPPEKKTPVCDTVGAGDAFAAVLIVGHLNGWPLELTLSRAQALASEVVRLRGATTVDPDFYRRFREEWGGR